MTEGDEVDSESAVFYNAPVNPGLFCHAYSGEDARDTGRHWCWLEQDVTLIKTIGRVQVALLPQLGEQQ